MPKKLDTHHLLFPRKSWNSGYAHALRQHWYFAIEIPRTTLHAQIHESVTHVPVPSGQNAKNAYEQIVMLESYGALKKSDPIEKRLKLLIALFDYAEPETADALKKQLDAASKFRKKSPSY